MLFANLKSICTFFLLTFLYSSILAQSKTTVDSLKQVLKTKVTDRQKVDIYHDIIEASSDSVQIAYYAKLAITLAKKINYMEGVVNIYYGQGWAALNVGNYDLANDFLDQLKKGLIKISTKEICTFFKYYP